jgi:predicted Zn-dependent peptidase
MAENFDKYILKNGLVIVGERMPSVESAAFEFMMPAGAAQLPEGACGAANVIEDWIFRGAGNKNSRQLGDALDGLGLHRSSSVGSSHLTIASVMESSNLEQAIDLYTDIILRPRLEDDQFEPARQLAIDDIAGLDDDPKQKVMLKLREQFYPYPLGRSTAGDIEQLKKMTAGKTRLLADQHLNLSQTIFSIAGKYNFDKIIKQMKKLFEAAPKKANPPICKKSQTEKYTHIHNDGAQVHIGLMTPIAPPADEDYYNARVAISILSGSMSSRLFTEVREKRGLCYAIGARYHSLKDLAGVMCYAGTTPEKAQETIDIIIAEFRRLADGITDEEIRIAKVGLKSALILQSESSSSRAGSIGSDYYILGRIRSLDEIREKIEQTTADSVLDFLQKNQFSEYTIATIGPKEIKIDQQAGGL